MKPNEVLLLYSQNQVREIPNSSRPGLRSGVDEAALGDEPVEVALFPLDLRRQAGEVQNDT